MVPWGTLALDLTSCFPEIFSELDESAGVFLRSATLLRQVKKCRRLAYFVTRSHDVQSLNKCFNGAAEKSLI